MEDTQPNELRLSRKGSVHIPRVRTTRPIHAPYPAPSKRPRWQPPANRTSFPHKHELIVHLPPECHKRAPGSYNARKRWIEDQKYHLQSDRHLSVVSFTYMDSDNSVLFICHTQQAPQSAGHNARESVPTRSNPIHIHLHRPAPSINNNRTGLGQSNAPRPCPIEPSPTGLGGCPQRPDGQFPIPPSNVEAMPTELSATASKSRPAQTLPRSPVPRRVAVRCTPPAESDIDLTLDYPDPSAEEHTTRWSAFQSGCLSVSLPPLRSDATSLSPEARPDNRPKKVVGQSEDTLVVPTSATNPRSVFPGICSHGTVPLRPSEARQVCESLPDQQLQRNVLEATGSSHLRLGAQGDAAEVSSSSPDYSISIHAFVPASGNLPLPLGPHDKPRRILHDHDLIYVVTAHGIIDQVGTAGVLKLDHNIRSPSLPYGELVDDACILSHQGDPVIILGHAREQDQVAFLSTRRGQVSRHVTLHRGGNTTKRPGVSAMTSLMSPLKFASGGYDHRVHLWDISHDLSGASAVELAIRHTSLIHCLLPVVDTSHKLVSVGADRDIRLYDLSAERVSQTLKTSCTPYHAHSTDSRSCTLLEVAHLETQFEIRDHRMVSQAVQRFGFLAEERRGRYEKADSWSHFVACGDRNGVVHLWDLRNVSKEIALRPCFNDPVIQVVHAGPRLLACSKKNELASIDLWSAQGILSG